MAPRRSRKKAGKVAPGAERRRQRRVEEHALRDLQSTYDRLETEGRLERSREGRVISINLVGCSMSALPDSIGGLKALTALDLAKCMSLTTLPESIGGLTALQTLTLDHCFALAALPAAIGELKSLTQLNINFCESLLALPDEIGGLVALKHLFMAMCVKLTALPKTIGDLKALTVLTLGSCLSLAELPDAIGGLTALKELDLEGCTSLVALPDSIGELGALTELNLEGCSSLAALPSAIETMPNLGPINGWEERPLSSYARFLQLARPRVNAEHPELANEVIDGIISDFWSFVCEARRAKLADPHHGTPYGEFLVGNLIHEIRRNKRRTCDFCGQKGPLAEDRFPVCWCGARRYCGEECQKLDWDRGHSQTCASGYTWSNEDLDAYWTLNGKQAVSDKAMEILRQQAPNILLGATIRVQQYEEEKKEFIEKKKLFYAKNPPPADRER
jgi:hypothetical protein